jgi:hypothetical protein
MLSSMSSVASIYNYHHRVNRLRMDKSRTAGNTYRGGQVQYRLACYESFFMIVFDLYINNVHNAIEFAPA